MRIYIVTLVLLACVEPTSSYDPGQDDTAMAAITRTWSQPGGDMTLSLCEDTATASSTPPNGCSIAYVVRGGGLGTMHTEDMGGCGGCSRTSVAYVTGTISGGGLPAAKMVTGQVMLDADSTQDPYAYPYSLCLAHDDEQDPEACTTHGTLDADGTLHLTIDGVTPGSGADLVPTGASPCSA